MKNFEEICDEYGLSVEKLDSELFSTLITISENKKPILTEPVFYYEKVNFLHLNGYILRDSPLNKLTGKGARAIKRGWVYVNLKDYKKQKNKELWRRITPNILQTISIVVAIALGVLGLFFPRKDSSKAANEIENVVTLVNRSTTYTTTHVNEIDQAADSTDLQKDSSDTK